MITNSTEYIIQNGCNDTSLNIYPELHCIGIQFVIVAGGDFYICHAKVTSRGCIWQQGHLSHWIYLDWMSAWSNSSRVLWFFILLLNMPAPLENNSSHNRPFYPSPKGYWHPPIWLSGSGGHLGPPLIWPFSGDISETVCWIVFILHTHIR